MTNESDYKDAIVEELKRAGIAEYEFQHGGKHPRVVFYHDGKRQMLVYPKTPSDSYRGRINCIADLRRRIGLAAPEQPKSTRAPKRRIKAKAPPVDLTMTVSADPLAVLTQWRPPSRFRWQQTSNRHWTVHVLKPPD